MASYLYVFSRISFFVTYISYSCVNMIFSSSKFLLEYKKSMWESNYNVKKNFKKKLNFTIRIPHSRKENIPYFYLKNIVKTNTSPFSLNIILRKLDLENFYVMMIFIVLMNELETPQ